MTIKDWIYLAITVATYAIAIIAGVYAKDKHKINRATRAGQIMDVIGKLATNAVHEAEYSGLENSQKREMASDIISAGLRGFGIKNVSANVIDGAIEKAVNAMHLANADTGNSTDAQALYDAANKYLKSEGLDVGKNIPSTDIVDPKDVADHD